MSVVPVRHRSHRHHLLDGVIDLSPDDGSCLLCHGVDGYLTTVQAAGLKGSAAVDGDRPVIAEVNECAQHHSREPRAVSARGRR
jgi:hypothetical protein